MSIALPRPKPRNLYLPDQVNQESMNKLTKAVIEINEDDKFLAKLYGIHDLEYKRPPIQRFGYKHSTPLYHQVSTGFQGKVQDMEDSLVETKRLQKKIEDITLERTSISKKKLTEILKNKKDWFMTAEEALGLGVIDGIL